MVDKSEDKFLEFMAGLDESLESKKSRSPDPSLQLTRYRILVERAVRWSSRQSYFELVKSFIKKEIGGEKFHSEFFQLWYEDRARVRELRRKIEENSEPIPDFSYTSKSVGFTSAIGNLFFDVDRYDSDADELELESGNIVYSEAKLRSVVKEQYFPDLEKYYEIPPLTNLQSPIQLDQIIQRNYNILLLMGSILLINLITPTLW